MLILLWTAQDIARADDVSFRMGMGILNGERTGAIKTFSIREEQHAIGPIHTAYEGGLWTDTGSSQGRRSSAFALGQIGVKPGAERGLYGSAFLGIAGITHPDSQLGGVGQFSENFGLGIRDGSSFIGVDYRHLSSAGIFKPNKGRDFLVFSVGVSL